MKVTRLKLENFRGFESLDLDLDRRLTVLIGVNASGKSTILDALAAVVGRAIEVDAEGFSDRDIRVGTNESAVALHGSHTDIPFALTCTTRSGEEETSEKPDGLLPRFPHYGELALATYYSSLRRVREIDVAAIQKDPASLGWRGDPRRLAFTSIKAGDGFGGFELRIDALARDGINFDDFFGWFRVREDIENEQARAAGGGQLQPYADPQLKAVREAIGAMLPGLTGLRVERREGRMVVDKGGAKLDLNLLSGGEKHLLAMFGDIARRLAIAYPALKNPLEGEIIILIDEVELHLHPSWQRTVVRSLRQAFPGAQLILTTHSPIVLSEVETSAVIALEDFKAYSAGSATKGRDANAILSQVMSDTERPAAFRERLHHVGDLIEKEDFDGARADLTKLEEELTGDDVEVRRLSSLIRFLEGPREAHPQGK